MTCVDWFDIIKSVGGAAWKKRKKEAAQLRNVQAVSNDRIKQDQEYNGLPVLNPQEIEPEGLEPGRLRPERVDVLDQTMQVKELVL